MVNVPDLKPGTYTMQLALDTHGSLGLLVSKRPIVIEDPLYDVLSTNYSTYTKEGNLAEAKKTRRELLAKWFKRRIKPGEPCRIDKPAQVMTPTSLSLLSLQVSSPGGRPGRDTWTDKFSAVFRWYPEKDCLRVVADVIDAYLSTDAPADTPWETSTIEILTSPSGASDTINQFFIVPEGPPDNPRKKAVHTDKVDKIKAKWLRTTNGYTVEARIPWSIMRGYEKGWTVMPVEAMVDTRSPIGRIQIFMNKPGEAWRIARTYAALSAPKSPSGAARREPRPPFIQHSTSPSHRPRPRPR